VFRALQREVLAVDGVELNDDRGALITVIGVVPEHSVV
jgi:hypothetical protein